MKTRRIPRTVLVLLLLPALLAGCGGGGNGGDGPPPAAASPSGASPAPSPAGPSGSSLEQSIAARLERQPVFRDVKPEALWRTGATGKGVRIAIEDQPMDILQEEFRGRIASAGGEYTYTYFPRNTYQAWLAGSLTEEDWRSVDCGTITSIYEGARCRQFDVTTSEEAQTRAKLEIERSGRYPGRGEIWIVRVTGSESSMAEALQVIPSPRQVNDGELVRPHGTWVGSTAAGAAYGMAPGATLVPIVITLGEEGVYDQGITDLARDVLDHVLTGTGVFSPGQVRTLDGGIAGAIRDDYSNADIVNQSYGISSWSNWDLRNQHLDIVRFWRNVDSRLPQASRAFQQRDTPEQAKTLVVTAAGNDSDWVGPRAVPAPTATMGVYYPELRGLAFAVAALGEDGRIASYSNYCGNVPSERSFVPAWDTARHGRHYCISAPGTVRARSPDGTVATVSGTSFAAPIVSGALAVMKEHFRGRLTPRELGLRMVNTADNTGVYADAAVYGAGALDLEAALRPVGSARTGLPGGTADLGATYLETPLAWGDVGTRVGSVEIAAFDDWNAPFWSDLGSRFQSAAGSFPPPAPAQGGWDAPEAFALPHLAWTQAPDSGESATLDWGLAFGASQKGTIDSFGLSAQPLRGSSLRFGLVYEGGANQGAKPSGAFGEGVSTHFVFASRSHARALGDGPFSVEASWTLLAGRADYPSSAMVHAGAGLYTAGRIGLALEGEDAKTRFSVSQPLRAESGSGTLTFPHDRTLEGEWLYRSQRFDLAPDAREVRLALRHDREWGGGKLALEVGHAVDAGHRAGEDVRFAGLGYRLQW